MDPDIFSEMSGCLSRPCFISVKIAPRIGGKAAQDEYTEAVCGWCAFHDLLPDSNSNKLEKILWGPIFKSKCYKRGDDLANCYLEGKPTFKTSVQCIVIAIHKRDPFYFISDVFADFNGLFSTTFHQNENVNSSESQFEAGPARFNAHVSGTILRSPIALMGLVNSNVDKIQRAFTLAANFKSILLVEEGVPPSTEELFADIK